MLLIFGKLLRLYLAALNCDKTSFRLCVDLFSLLSIALSYMSTFFLCCLSIPINVLSIGLSSYLFFFHSISSLQFYIASLFGGYALHRGLSMEEKGKRGRFSVKGFDCDSTAIDPKQPHFLQRLISSVDNIIRRM